MPALEGDTGAGALSGRGATSRPWRTGIALIVPATEQSHRTHRAVAQGSRPRPSAFRFLRLAALLRLPLLRWLALRVAPETEEICQALGVDPLKLISSGCMVITAKESEGLLNALNGKGIKATMVGRILEKAQGRFIVLKGEGRGGRPISMLTFPERDELYRVLAPG